MENRKLSSVFRNIGTIIGAGGLNAEFNSTSSDTFPTFLECSQKEKLSLLNRDTQWTHVR